MQTPAQEAYIKIRAKLLKAPGMIEESERRLLFKLSRSCGKNSIIEFGSFFGASSLALYEGMKQNNYNQSKLYCIDAFEVHEEHPLHQHVIDFAKKAKI